MPVPFLGLYTAVVTPFTRSGEIDKDAFRQHLEFQINNGVDGIVVCGTTGESPTFSNKEFEYLVSMTASLCSGKCQVIAGSGTNSTQKSINRSKIAEQAGADGLLIVSPYYNKPAQSGLLDHYTTIANAVELPIMVYNVPGRTSVNILPETIVKMAAHPNIAGVKEACGDIQQIMELIRNVPGDFPVLSGDDAMTLPVIAAGGKGLVSVAANQAPALMKQYVDACLQEDLKTARQLHYRLQPLMEANFWESNPIPVKAALSMMGRMENVLRLPLSPLKSTYEPGLRKILKELNLL